MRNLERAKNAALEHLAENGFDEVNPTIRDASTKEFDAGWVFYYQSARFIETNDIQYGLGTKCPDFYCLGAKAHRALLAIISRWKNPLLRSKLAEIQMVLQLLVFLY